MKKRPGTTTVADALAGNIRIVGMTPNYVVEFTDLMVRVLDSSGVVATLTAPWTGAQVTGIRTSQYGQCLYIAHPEQAPRRLCNDGGDWSLAEDSYIVVEASVPDIEPVEPTTPVPTGTGTPVTVTLVPSASSVQSGGTVSFTATSDVAVPEEYSVSIFTSSRGFFETNRDLVFAANSQTSSLPSGVSQAPTLTSAQAEGFLRVVGVIIDIPAGYDITVDTVYLGVTDSDGGLPAPTLQLHLGTLSSPRATWTAVDGATAYEFQAYQGSYLNLTDPPSEFTRVTAQRSVSLYRPRLTYGVTIGARVRALVRSPSGQNELVGPWSDTAFGSFLPNWNPL